MPNLKADHHLPGLQIGCSWRIFSLITSHGLIKKMSQTKARKTLKDAPVMWRRINSIGVILDCNSTYAANLGYAKSEILGKPIFEHISKDSWEAMNESLKTWFDTGKGHRQENHIQKARRRVRFQGCCRQQAFMMRTTTCLAAIR